MIVFSKLVSAAFQQKFELARSYAYSANFGTSDIIFRLASLEPIVHLTEETTKPSNFDEGMGLTPTINWNPHSCWRPAAGAARGSGRSPALGLVHEAAHAYLYLVDPATYMRKKKTVDARSRAEAPWLEIEGYALEIQNAYARRLGEAQCRDYMAGVIVGVSDPLDR